MEGKEVRKTLQEHRINLTWLAEQLGISPQGLNSRLNAHLFKSSYLQEITNILQKDIFGVGAKPDMQPVLNIRVRDNITEELSTTNFPVIEHVCIPAFTGCLGFIYYGKDAEPRYEAGDIIFILPKTEAIKPGRKYLIITDNDRFVRLACEAKKKDYIRLSAINLATDAQGARIYPDTEIKTSDILHAYKVVGSISRDQI